MRRHTGTDVDSIDRFFACDPRTVMVDKVAFGVVWLFVDRVGEYGLYLSMNVTTSNRVMVNESQRIWDLGTP